MAQLLLPPVLEAVLGYLMPLFDELNIFWALHPSLCQDFDVEKCPISSLHILQYVEPTARGEFDIHLPNFLFQCILLLHLPPIQPGLLDPTQTCL